VFSLFLEMLHRHGSLSLSRALDMTLEILQQQLQNHEKKLSISFNGFHFFPYSHALFTIHLSSSLNHQEDVVKQLIVNETYQ
jgi:hypothetical protein